MIKTIRRIYYITYREHKLKLNILELSNQFANLISCDQLRANDNDTVSRLIFISIMPLLVPFWFVKPLLLDRTKLSHRSGKPFTTRRL